MKLIQLVVLLLAFVATTYACGAVPIAVCRYVNGIRIVFNSLLGQKRVRGRRVQQMRLHPALNIPSWVVVLCGLELSLVK